MEKETKQFYEKELNEIQTGCSLHERALIRMGFEAALKLALAQSSKCSPKLPSSNKIRKHFKKIGWEYCDDVTLENTLLAIKKLGTSYSRKRCAKRWTH